MKNKNLIIWSIVENILTIIITAMLFYITKSLWVFLLLFNLNYFKFKTYINNNNPNEQLFSLLKNRLEDSNYVEITILSQPLNIYDFYHLKLSQTQIEKLCTDYANIHGYSVKFDEDAFYDLRKITFEKKYN